MTENEKEFIDLIRNSDNPQTALYIAAGIVAEISKECDEVE